MTYIKQYIKLLINYYRLPNHKFYKFPMINKYNGKAFVLATGPSLKHDLEEYDVGNRAFDENTFVVNLFPNDAHFKKIKPKHLCLSDPMFYHDYPGKTESIRKMYDILQNEVDWDIYVYICFFSDEENEKLISYSRVTNKYIHFIKLNRKHCSNLIPNLRNKLYSTGRYMPEDGTIANTAIYVALLEGFKEIELYGVDHTMCHDLVVNEKNELCSLDTHFYDNEKPILKPFIDVHSTDNKPFKVNDFFYIMYVMFNSHELLKSFADYLGAKIYNCTPNSMIDSYERKLLD